MLSGSFSVAPSGPVLAVVAVAEQRARPDHRVEDDVVLPHEVRVLGLRVLPPLAPGIGRAAVLGPLDRRGEVADHRVEPDVDPLVVLILVALERDRHSPVEVARDRARLQLLDEVEREPPDVLPPVLLRLDPGRQLLLERGQVEKEVLRLLEDGCRPVDPRTRVDQVGGIELVAAVVALVAARALEAADRARALDVAIGKRVPGRGGERPERLLLDDVALAMERAKEVLGDAVVVGGRGPREEVVREPEVAKIVADELAEPLGGLMRRLAGGVRRDHDRRPVLVRPAHHEDVVAAHAVIAGERVRRDPEARHVADVAQAARIRPRDRNQNLPSGARRAHRGE